MSPAHHTPALSASRLALYRECPALYRRRYVDGIFDPPTIDMEYGQAIHHALEAMFLGQDADLALLRELKGRLAPLVAAGADPADWLVPQGLRLLRDVQKLSLEGSPERRFLFAHPEFRIPFRGIIDLWQPAEKAVIDWKTTRHPWSENTAANYSLQRVVYSQAIMAEFGLRPAFAFVALGAYPGGYVQVVPATPTDEQIEAAFFEAHGLYLGIEAEQWTCTCGHHQEQAA